MVKLGLHWNEGQGVREMTIQTEEVLGQDVVYDVTELLAQELKTLNNEQLCVLYQAGYESALEMLLIKNERLIYSRVRRFINLHRHKLEFEDLVSYGREGMMIAATKFECSRRSKFTTYCTFWIDQKIVRAIHDYGFTIRFPVHLFEVLRKVTREQQLFPQLDEDVLIEKLVVEQQLNEIKVRQVLVLKSQLLQIPSLNVHLTDDSHTEMQDAIPDDDLTSAEDVMMQHELKHVMKQLVETLSEKEQFVLARRYGLNHERIQTLEEIGTSLGVTRERVRQIELKALRKLAHPSRQKQLAEFIELRRQTTSRARSS